jgi:hypothetical protein
MIVWVKSVLQMMPRKPDERKHCAACGRLMTRKRYGGTLESNLAFRRRKYCDRLCMAAEMTQDEPTLAALRKRAVRLRGGSCETCCATEAVSIHHVNGNPADNRPENLMTLCASCHTKWHWDHGKQALKRQSVCVICGMPARKLDMCQKHYQRFKKYGDPCLTKKKGGSGYVLVRETLCAQNGQESPE